MEKPSFFKRFYARICSFLSVRNISWVSLVLFMILLVPICYLSFVNRASGDDYGYGVYTRAAWMTSHSLIEVAKAIGYTIKRYYVSWQGTWFSIAVFSLQPEVFHDKAYVIVVFLMLFLWIGSTALLFWQIGVREYGWDKWSYLLVLIVYLIIATQFIPSTKSSIFWFNGCAHYMLPFAMCQVTAWFLIRFIKKYQIRYLIGIGGLMALLGGSNYQAALFTLIILVYVAIADFIKSRDRKIFLLGIPFLMEIIGLVISMKAPGNKVRGGESFGFSVSKAVVTVGECFLEGFRGIGDYLLGKTVVFIGLVVLFLVFLEACKGVGSIKKIKHPIIIILALFCLYCAMQAPELYADVEVSGGVHNMNYLTFLLFAAGSLGILAICISGKLKISKDILHNQIVIPGLLICFLFLVICKGNLKESTSWVSMDYIRSGQAADYKVQMDLQTEILTDEKVENAVIPFINDVQGPLMSMPATDNPKAWTNTVMRQFYEKNSVVAMPRTDWEEMQERR